MWEDTTMVYIGLGIAVAGFFIGLGIENMGQNWGVRAERIKAARDSKESKWLHLEIK